MSAPEWLEKVDPDAAREFRVEFQVLAACIDASGKLDLRTSPFASRGLRFYPERETVDLPSNTEKRFREVASWSGLGEPPEQQRRFALTCCLAVRACQRQETPNDFARLVEIATYLFRHKLPLQRADVPSVLDGLIAVPRLATEGRLISGVLKAVELAFHGQSLGSDARQRINTLREAIFAGDSVPKRARQKLIEQLDRLCSDAVTQRLQPDDGWADAVRSTLATLAADARTRWEELCRHAADVRPAKPAKGWVFSMDDIGPTIMSDDTRHEVYSRRTLDRHPDAEWRDSADRLVAAVGSAEFVDCMVDWLEHVPKSRPGALARECLNRELLRGLLWCCVGFDDLRLVRAIRAAGDFLFKKNSPLGTAVVQVLSRMPGNSIVTELGLMRSRLKADVRQHLVLTAMRDRAAALGLHEGDVEDIGLPTFGMTAVGVRREERDDFLAELAATGRGRVELRWFKPDGRTQKSVPAKAAASYPDLIRDLKTAAKELQAALPALTHRLEAAWLDRRTWSYPVWRERYLDHPVAGIVARRLIWTLRQGAHDVSCAWHKEMLVTPDGGPISPDPAAQVTLWHPVESTADEVRAWREWLYAVEVTQPFKQAHREIYLLADAERTTRTYSNRFAAHVLKQRQFRAIAKGRGWNCPYCGPWDAGNDGVAQRTVGPWGLRADLWVGGAADAYEHAGGYEYVATDQVRFYPASERSTVSRPPNQRAGDAPLPLEEVPPQLFSEIMRDVDLFVGVASVGNDPNWSDGGPEGRYRGYWHSYSFGDLLATAETRKEVLQQLVPRLKIADRCSFDDRFLVVRGDLRTYKIHLGSSNILMSPDDQYLCIVPLRRGDPLRDKVFLPFEGDATLSVILSKALLLADDRRITDATILRQIEVRRASARAE